MPCIRRRNIFAIASVAAVVASTLVGANVVSADSVWVQSYERTSQTEACAAQVGETPWQASWGDDSSWSPSWAQWANGGKGGWVCTRSITWARTTAAEGSSTVTYALGDIGPGGGLVFYDAGSVQEWGQYLEMAPNTWSGLGTPDERIAWCNNSTSDVTGAVGTAIGTGSSNTIAMDVACTSGAGQEAADYPGGAKTDWFLPSKDELTAMYNYKLVMPIRMLAAYGFDNYAYWSSSQIVADGAYYKDFTGGYSSAANKFDPFRVRPVRAF